MGGRRCGAALPGECRGRLAGGGQLLAPPLAVGARSSTLLLDLAPSTVPKRRLLTLSLLTCAPAPSCAQGSANPVKQRIAVALCHLSSADMAGSSLELMFVEKKGLVRGGVKRRCLSRRARE